MKNALKAILILTAFVFVFTQCDKTPIESEVDADTGQAEIIEAYNAAEQIGYELDALEDSALTDSTIHLERRARMALHRLNEMLNRVGPVIERSGDEEAKALFRQALDARDNAVDAVEAGEYEQAFEYIQESRHYVMEALRLIRNDIIVDKEEIIERLEQGIADTQALLDDVSAALAEQENEVAQNLYDRAVSHLDKAREALANERLRAAGFHLKQANKLAHLAMRILENNG